MSRLSEALASGNKVITAEVTPPKGAGIKKLLANANILKPFVEALNVTDCQRALVRMSSLAASKVLLENGIEPVYQLTCRDRNTIALQSDLMGAGALGIPNLLCLTGDPVKAGDCTDSKSVFELEAIGLLKLAAQLQSGRDRHEHKMNKGTRFHIGAVVNPTLRSNQLDRMQKKSEAGAQFFQTQANYDLEDFAAFLREAKTLGVKILAGILILPDHEMAEFIHQNIPGIQVPNTLIERLRHSSDAMQTGIDYAVETMLAIEPYCDGFHLMSIRAEDQIPIALERYHARKFKANPAL